MPVPVLQAEGAIANVTVAGSNLVVTLPTYAADDIVVITSVGWVPNTTTGTATMSLSSPWTKYSPNVTSVVSSLIDGEWAFFWARATSASSLGSTVTITRPANWDTGNDTAWGGRAYVIRGCITTGNPYDQLTATALSTAANQAFPAITVSGTARLPFIFYCSSDNNTAPTAATGWSVNTAVTDAGGTDVGFQSYDIVAGVNTSTSTVTPTGGAAPAQGFAMYFAVSFVPSTTRTASGAGNAAYADSYVPTKDGQASLTAANPHYGQGFKPAQSGKLFEVEAQLYRNTGTVTGNLVCQLYSAGTGTYGSTQIPGTLLATSDGISATSISTSTAGTWYAFRFSGANQISLTAGTAYYAVIYHANANAASPYIQVTYISSTGIAEGNAVYSSSSGPTFFADSAGRDMLYRVSLVSAQWATKLLRTASGAGTGTQTAVRKVSSIRTASGVGTGTQSGMGRLPKKYYLIT